MRRGLVLGLTLLVGAVLPTAASAADWRGVVVAKDSARDALVTSSGGTLRTLRAPGRFSSVRVGSRIAARGARLADGTFRSRGLQRIGRRETAVVHVTVVRQQGNRGRTIVSGGGTVFALRGGDEHEVGDELDCIVEIKPSGRLKALDCEETGQADVLELEGIFLDAGEGILRLAVVKRGLVVVTVPDGMELPEYEAGDLIEIVVSVDAEGSFVLVAAQYDEGKDDDGDGVEHDDDGLVVEGVLVGIVDGVVEVSPGEGTTAVSCVAPLEADLSAFEAGDEVRMLCAYADDDTLVLVKLKSESARWPAEDEHECLAEGCEPGEEEPDCEVSFASTDEPCEPGEEEPDCEVSFASTDEPCEPGEEEPGDCVPTFASTGESCEGEGEPGEEVPGEEEPGGGESQPEPEPTP